VTALELAASAPLAVRTHLEAGQHVRLLLAGPIFVPPRPDARTDFALRICDWSEPNAITCPKCGTRV
jgi:hypothetical protein